MFFPQEHLSVRCLSSSSDSNVAYTDCRHVCLADFLESAVIEEMSELEGQPIREKKYLVYHLVCFLDYLLQSVNAAYFWRFVAPFLRNMVKSLI